MAAVLRFIFARAAAAFSEVGWPAARSSHVYAPRAGVRGILAYLRLGELTAGTHFLDFTGFERAVTQLAVTVVYWFTALRWGLRLGLCTTAPFWRRVPGAAEFFSGAIWPERECADMLGIALGRKLDARRLMVDYTFEGAPLLRQFPAAGFEELEFSALQRSLAYATLRLRDEGEVFGP
jgi:NADH:ubiquinone oxidoreductase subunit C